MALTRTARYSGTLATGDETIVSSSFTPNNNSLLVAVFGGIDVAAEDHIEADVLISGGGLQWTKRAYKQRTEFGNISFVTIWTAPVISGASMSVTATADVSNLNGYDAVYLTVTEYTGYDVYNPIGATITGERTGTAGSWTLTLNGAPDLTSEIIAGMTLDYWSGAADRISTGTGWTAILDSTGPLNAETFGHVQVRPAGSTSSAVLWDNADTSGSTYISLAAAIEIRASINTHNISPSWNDETKRIGWPDFPTVNASGAVANTGLEAFSASILKAAIVGRPFDGYSFSTYSIAHTVGTNVSYHGGILSPTGEMHFPNYNGNRGMKLNRQGTFSTYSLVYTTSGAYISGVLAPNGEIHFVPHQADRGQKIAADGTVSTYSLVYTAGFAYFGGILSPNGDVHFIPHAAAVGQKVNPSGTVSTYSLVYTNSSGAYQGGVLNPRGEIHMVPYSANRGQKIAIDGTVTTYSLVYTTSFAYAGGVLAPNGDVHFIPYFASVGQKVSPEGVVSTYPLVYTAEPSYWGGVLAPNGDVHFVPFGSAAVGQKIDINGVVSTYSLPSELSGSNKFGFGYYFNGAVWFHPRASTLLGYKLHLPSAKDFNGIQLSPFLNKTQ